MSEDAPRTGTFTLSLGEVTGTRAAGDGGVLPSLPLWCHAQLEQADGQPLESFWFGADDENATTSTLTMPEGVSTFQRLLDYQQSSRAVPLTPDAMVTLMGAGLRLALYGGDTHSRGSDTCYCEQRIDILPVLLAERVDQRVTFSAVVNDSIQLDVAVSVTLQCDTDLSNYMLGARVLRLRSLGVEQPPKEWIGAACESDDDATKWCESSPAQYDVELSIPDFASPDDSTSRSVRFTGGKMRYTPSSSPPSEENNEEGAPPSLTGTWRVVFPDVEIHQLFLKPAVSRLLDFLHVEKRVTGLLRRLHPEHAGRVTVPLRVSLAGLVTPGCKSVEAQSAVRQAKPIPREAIEQELAAATANDEKKRLQATLNDYDGVIVQAAATLVRSLASAKTQVKCVVDVLNSALVLVPPPSIRSSKTIDELLSPRDLELEYEQRRDVVKDLRAEIRRVVLLLLREFEAATPIGDELTREETRQRIVFKLNSQGTYHSFKEKLKKRIVPLIRDRFAALEDEDEDGGGDKAEANDPNTTVSKLSAANVRKKKYFAQLYATLMEEVHLVLHETFNSNHAIQLEQQLVPSDEEKTAQTLHSLWLRALENEVNGDLEKSESLHLDRIAFAEERSVEQPGLPTRPPLNAVWFDYARLCLVSGELDKAASALRQSLSLDAHGLPSAQLAYGALLCELRDFTGAEQVLAATLTDAQAAASSGQSDRLIHLARAHALQAFFYTQSGRDETGNLALFELLRAQAVVKRLRSEVHGEDAVSLSSSWILLASQVHEWHLRGTTQLVLHLAAQYREPRDVLTRNERVQLRVIEAELLSLRGEAAQAVILLREALEIQPSDPFAWLVLGKINLQLESTAVAAIDCLQRAVEQRCQMRTELRLSAFMHLGLVLLQSSRLEQARETFLVASDEYPIASAWLGVGIACLRVEDWNNARVALAEANRLDPTNPEVWGYMALVTLSTTPRLTPHHESDVKQLIAQALRYQLSNPGLLRELSNAFVALDRLEDAEKLLRRSLVLQDVSMTRKTLADVLASQNCAEDALAQYKQSLAVSVDVAERCELLEKCAALLVTLGRAEEAEEYRAMATRFAQQEDYTSGGGDRAKLEDQRPEHDYSSPAEADDPKNSEAQDMVT
ncbi:hypothetical protein ATCC90586_007754 [Pythium insidiosum]|nr:hypothetical protein ATCC90586_007754 [Pythium insidiosum]